MEKQSRSLMFFCATAIAAVAAGASRHEGGTKLLRMQLTNFSEQMRELQRQEFDIAGVDLKAQTVDVIVDEESMGNLEKSAPFKVLMTQDIDRMAAPDQKYHTPQEVQTELQAFAQSYPAIAQLESVGKSLEGRDIWAIKISDNVAQHETDEPTVFFNSMHHAREVMTTEVGMDTVEYLLKNYGSDQRVTNWVNNTEIWVMPMFNVDGNNKVWSGDSMWRKNVRGGYGVDINRNYTYAWNTCNGSSGSQFAQDYRGPSAGSEPETQVMMAFVARIKPVFSISYHSYSELVLYPYGCDGEHTPTMDIVEPLGQKMAGLIQSDSGNGGYDPGTPWELLYAVDGGDIDWMYHDQQVIPYVIELNSTSQGFQPSYDRWRNVTVERARAAWMLLLDRAQESGIRGVIPADAATGPVVGTVKVKSLTNSQLREQDYRINPDGTFHIVLNPGKYHVAIDANIGMPQVHEIEVGAGLVNLTL